MERNSISHEKIGMLNFSLYLKFYSKILLLKGTRISPESHDNMFVLLENIIGIHDFQILGHDCFPWLEGPMKFRTVLPFSVQVTLTFPFHTDSVAVPNVPSVTLRKPGITKVVGYTPFPSPWYFILHPTQALHPSVSCKKLKGLLSSSAFYHVVVGPSHLLTGPKSQIY